MIEYRCTWWEFTGRHSPDDGNGIMHAIYRKLDTGEETDDLPVGALLVSESGPKGPDGLSVACIVPYSNEGVINSTTWWHIDSRANNCTKPDDKEHRCWVRHGTLGGEIHVDKNGYTCSAGAGSIGVPGFHGFLHRGVLRDA